MPVLASKVFKECMSFFLGSLGLNRSAEQTNRREPFHGLRDLFVSCSDSSP